VAAAGTPNPSSSSSSPEWSTPPRGQRHSCLPSRCSRWRRPRFRRRLRHDQPRIRVSSIHNLSPGFRPWKTFCRTTSARVDSSAASTAAYCSSSGGCTFCTPRCTASPARGSAASVTGSAPTRTSSRYTSSTSSTTADEDLRCRRRSFQTGGVEERSELVGP